jgi:hypothetical protein
MHAGADYGGGQENRNQANRCASGASAIAGVLSHGPVRMISASMLIRIAVSGCGMNRLKCAFIFLLYAKIAIVANSTSRPSALIWEAGV